MRTFGWVAVVLGLFGLGGSASATTPEQVRVMIVTAFADEAGVWERARLFARAIPVPGEPRSAVQAGQRNPAGIASGRRA